MTTLEDLYYGNISPWERDIKRGSRMDKLVKLIANVKKKLGQCSKKTRPPALLKNQATRP